MKDWMLRFLTANGKTHNVVLLITAFSFSSTCWRCADATVIGAVGATLATLYGANSWAGTKAHNPPPAT